MAFAETALARSFDDLANLVHGAPGLRVRIQRSDGSAIEGPVLSVGDGDLFVRDNATRSNVQVFAHELQALDVSVPRRAREWMLAAIAIPATTAVLIGYSRLSWVHPERGDITTAIVTLFAIGAAVIAIPSLRKWLDAWLTNWRRVYPPVAPKGE